MKSLEQIFDHFGSDKGTLLEGHRYAQSYEELIGKNITSLLVRRGWFLKRGNQLTVLV